MEQKPEGSNNLVLKIGLSLLVIFNIALYYHSNSIQHQTHPPLQSKMGEPVGPDKPVLQGKSFRSQVDENSESNNFSEMASQAAQLAQKTTDAFEIPTGSGEATGLVTASTFEKDADGYVQLGFDVLSTYIYTTENGYPDRIKNLAGEKIKIIGFTMPMEVNDDRKVTSSLLIKDPPACCFGKNPKVNDWIMVKVENPAEAHIPLWSNSAFRVYGTFQATEEHEGGEIISVYQLIAHKVEEVKVDKPWWSMQ